jgi:hypothetical protein
MSDKKDDKKTDEAKEKENTPNLVSKTISLSDLGKKENEYDKKLTDKFSTKYIS